MPLLSLYSHTVIKLTSSASLFVQYIECTKHQLTTNCIFTEKDGGLYFVFFLVNKDYFFKRPIQGYLLLIKHQYIIIKNVS